MDLWKKLQKISFLKLLSFGFLVLKKPLLILPIIRATKAALRTSQELYGYAHNRNGKANAFRHAYWNYLICEKTLKITKNPQKSVIWTQKVTSFYEKVTKNELLDTAMDLHNNNLGRNQFLANFEQKSFNPIDFFKEMAQNALRIVKIEEIDSFNSNLVYISEKP